MKKVILAITMIVAIVGLSGCSATVRNASQELSKKEKLDPYVTYVCYDLINKKDCPSTLAQYDIDIFSLIPGESRFCFGFSEIIDPVDGMTCFNYDFIKND